MPLSSAILAASAHDADWGEPEAPVGVLLLTNFMAENSSSTVSHSTTIPFTANRNMAHTRIELE